MDVVIQQDSVRIGVIKESDQSGNDQLGISMRLNLLDDSQVDWFYLSFSLELDRTVADDATSMIADTYFIPNLVYQPGPYSGKSFFNELSRAPSSDVVTGVYLDSVAYKQKSWYNISKGRPLGDNHDELMDIGINKREINNQLIDSIQSHGFTSGGLYHYIAPPSKFRKRYADKIIDFQAERDILQISDDHFGLHGLQTFAAGKNKRVVKRKLARQDFDILYDQKKGGLYLNENGTNKGFGDGGLIAIIEGAPDLSANNIEFI